MTDPTVLELLEEDPLLTIPEVAQFLHIHEQTAWRYAWSGRLKTYSLAGTGRRAYLSDVRKLLRPAPIKKQWVGWTPKNEKKYVSTAAEQAITLLTTLGYDFED
jgi:hypothetical protein